MIRFLVVLLGLLGGIEELAQAQNSLPDRVLVGYWHNFNNAAGFVPLQDVPETYDVVNVAFAVPEPGSTSKMQFVPDAATSSAALIDEIQVLQARGQKVLISIGGATAVVSLETETHVQEFVDSMIEIIETYGFDGLDIDLEGSSLALEEGDDDFQQPTTPVVVNLIAAIQALVQHFGPDFILTAAPETAYVQGGLSAYGGIWGAYLPVLHALRDDLTLLHVQHYNTGSLVGLDAQVYQPETADFHVAMTDMLLQGFPVGGNTEHVFPALRPDQIAIGLPATPQAAGSGFTPPEVIHEALDYLIAGQEFGGTYTLQQAEGYSALRGLMTWSINWDLADGLSFSDPHRLYLDALGTPTDAEAEMPARRVKLEPAFPEPFTQVTSIGYELVQPSDVRLVLYDVLGREVEVLVNQRQPAGRYEVRFDSRTLPGGRYFYQLTTRDFSATRSLTLIR